MALNNKEYRVYFYTLLWSTLDIHSELEFCERLKKKIILHLINRAGIRPQIWMSVPERHTPEPLSSYSAKLLQTAISGLISSIPVSTPLSVNRHRPARICSYSGTPLGKSRLLVRDARPTSSHLVWNSPHLAHITICSSVPLRLKYAVVSDGQVKKENSVELR